jgi:hypothetical protein
MAGDTRQRDARIRGRLLRKGWAFSAVAGRLWPARVWRGLTAAENAAGGTGRTFSGLIELAGRRPAGEGVARGLDQAVVRACWCLWSFCRLWVAVIRRHSERAAERPRRWKRSMRRLNFVCPNTGSIMPLRLR